MFMPEEFDSGAAVPDRVFGYVSISSQGGIPATEADLDGDVEAFFADSDDHSEAERILQSAGFEILAESRLGMSISGPPGAFEELTGGQVVTRERLLYAEGGTRRYVTHLDVIGSQQPSTLGVAVVPQPSPIEAVLLERPRIPLRIFPSPVPPATSKFHLRVPDDVALVLGAVPAHRRGQVGDGVVVGMVDSGQYPHPYFAAHGYDVQPTVSVVPGTSGAKDPIGHGTGESANIFAIAPAATLRPYRASNNAGALVGAVAGFLRAKEGGPAIMTNSWGGDGEYPPPSPPDSYERAWSLEIRDAVTQGIVVIFSAGNGQFSIEPQVPEVISAGGAYIGPTLELRATNYTSGYSSPWFEGVTVPDVSGAVGLQPRAQYLMLPVPPRCEIDVDESQAAGGDTPDGTSSNDGWALFSGTSAAAPQLAGAVALILAAKPGLQPAQVTEALAATATDVQVGTCHPRFNHQATPGQDLATGFGLVNASAAVDYALAKF